MEKQGVWTKEVELQDASEFIAQNEAEMERELVKLIAKIIVTKTLNNASEKGYQVPPV